MQARRAICQVLAGAESGGLERHFIDLCNALAERHQVTAIAHPMHTGAFHGGVHFVPLDLSGGRFNPGLLLMLYRAVRRAAPDIVHTHANKATAMVALLKPLLSLSFVATLHNRKSRLWMFRSCDAVIAVSQSLADCLPGRDVTVIPNGIAPPAPLDAARVAAIKAPLAGQALVLAAGRLVEAKGFDVRLKPEPTDLFADILFRGHFGVLVRISQGHNGSNFMIIRNTQQLCNGIRSHFQRAGQPAGCQSLVDGSQHQVFDGG